MRQNLLAHYQRWRGTPYRYGGLSRSGVDCSGFVYLTYQSAIGFTVPRTTQALAQTGERVSKSQLRVGDLIFFNTGKKTRHVGIYLGNHEFLHASTSRGVIVSKLNNPYWLSSYWKARRVLN